MLLPVMVKYSGGVTVQFQEEELVLEKSLSLKTTPDVLAVDIQLSRPMAAASTRMEGRRNPWGILRNTGFFSE